MFALSLYMISLSCIREIRNRSLFVGLETATDDFEDALMVLIQRTRVREKKNG